jgi:hypothetical protein
MNYSSNLKRAAHTSKAFTPRKTSGRCTWDVITIITVALSLLLPLPTYAQVTGANVSGVVADSSGAAIANAHVAIKNEGTSLTRDLVTNSDGFYSASNLPPGTYTMSVVAQGFKSVTETGIVLAVGEERALNQKLQVGQVTDTITVTVANGGVSLVSSTVGDEVSPTTERELPLNGRDWTQLATLAPGVSPVRTQASTESATSNREQRGFGNQISISGHRPEDNNYRVNGISDMDYANSSPGSVIGAALGVDAIEEFSVLTSTFSAEYGRSDGGIINAVLKSGANNFHGDIYEFLRNKALDARNYFDPAQIPPFQRNQFGGSVGGPIKKGKTFFFFDYEGVRQNKNFSFNDNVPSAAVRNGVLCSVPNSTCTTTQLPVSSTTNANGINLSVVPFFGLYPLPNAGILGNGDVGIFKTSEAARFSENYYSGRVDQNFSEKDTLNGSYSYDKGPYQQPDVLGDVLVQNSTTRQLVTLEETHIFGPTILNTARIGYDRAEGLSNGPVKAINPLGADPSLGALPGRFAPVVNVSGLTQLSGSIGAASEILSVWNSFQEYDDLSITKGVHSLKLGLAVERLQYNEANSNSLNGLFTFGSLTNFLQNIPASVRLTDSSRNQPFGSRQTAYGAYVQDDWHIRPNLTLNLGLRYEPTTLPTEVKNRYEVVKDINGGLPVPVNTLWSRNATLKDFAPRVGFSWDPFGSGKTAVRGGVGLYDQLPLLWEYAHENSPAVPFAFNITSSTIPAGSFPSGVSAVLGGFQLKNAIARYIEQDPPRSFSANWSLNIQRQIGQTFTATVGYIGVQSFNDAVSYDDWNAVLPTKTAIGYLWPLPIKSGTRIDPNVGTLRTTVWNGATDYHALTAELKKRMSYGLQAQGSYTWGKCLDSGSGSAIGDPFQNSIANLPFFDPSQEHGPCDFNVAQTLVLNAVWNLPSFKSMGSIAEHTLGGWEVAGIFTAATGTPFTVLIAGDPVGQLSEAFAFPNRLPNCDPANGNYRNSQGVPQYLNVNCFTVPTAPASFASQCQPFPNATTPNSCQNLFGNAGRNQITGPGVTDFDFSLIKNNYIPRISESFNVQFRAEFFNILNHANFQSPLSNNTLFNLNGSPVAGAGTINQTSTDSRQIQFALKVMF